MVGMGACCSMFFFFVLFRLFWGSQRMPLCRVDLVDFLPIHRFTV